MFPFTKLQFALSVQLLTLYLIYIEATSGLVFFFLKGGIG